MSKALNRGSDRATGGAMMVTDLSLVPSGADFYVVVNDLVYPKVIPCSKIQLPVVEARLRSIYPDNVKVFNKKPTDLVGNILVYPATEYGG